MGVKIPENVEGTKIPENYHKLQKSPKNIFGDFYPWFLWFWSKNAGTVVGETLAGQTLAVFWIFLEIFKKSIFIYWKNIGKTKWTRRQNRWLLIIGIVTTELVHSFYDVHELFLPRYFNLERLLGLKFFNFVFFLIYCWLLLHVVHLCDRNFKKM